MLSVCVLVCSVLALSVCAQDEISKLNVLEAATEATEVVTEVMTDHMPVYVSDEICRECNCSDTTADCRKRELRRLFDVDDWIGLRYLNITDVDLSQNHFISVAQFPELPLKMLNLSSCEIEILEQASFSNLKDLTILDLSRNKISTASIGKREFLGILQEGKKPLPFANLRHLSLAYNDIHSLSQDIFAFIPYLTFLDLSGNPLTFIDQVTMGALTDLTKLKELRISECDLEILPEGLFRRQRRLERLDLSGNRFTTVPAVLSEAVNLLYLNFNRNPIQNLSERTAISNLIYLQELHLSRHSNLRTIAAGALGGLANLVVLHMRNNPRLTDLDPAFLEWEDDFGMERWPQLKELYLNNNNLSSIDSNMLDHWSQLSKADFSANPYSCDCSSQWMVDVLVPHLLQTTSNVTTTKMVCRRPEEYRGMTFAQLYEGEKKLTCSPSESLIDDSASDMAVMYGVLVGILVTFPIVLMIVILWKNGFFARCRKKMNSRKEHFYEEETDAL